MQTILKSLKLLGTLVALSLILAALLGGSLTLLWVGTELPYLWK